MSTAAGDFAEGFTLSLVALPLVFLLLIIVFWLLIVCDKVLPTPLPKKNFIAITTTILFYSFHNLG